MPYIPKPKKIKTGSSSIDALISFLGGDDDPAQSLMDTVNPAVAMARKAARKIAPKILPGNFGVAKDLEKEISTLKSKIDAVDAAGDLKFNSKYFRRILERSEKALAKMKGEAPPPKYPGWQKQQSEEIVQDISRLDLADRFRQKRRQNDPVRKKVEEWSLLWSLRRGLRDRILLGPRTFKTGESAKQALRMNNNLGFDSPGEAMGAILSDNDWRRSWELPDDGLYRIIERDRKRIKLEFGMP